MTESTSRAKPFVIFDIPEEPYVEVDEDLKLLQSIQGPRFEIPWDAFVVIENKSIMEFWVNAIGAPAIPITSTVPSKKTVSRFREDIQEEENIEMELFYVDILQLSDEQLKRIVVSLAKEAHLDAGKVMDAIAIDGLPVLAQHVSVYQQAKKLDKCIDNMPFGIRAEVAVNHSMQAQFAHETVIYRN